MSELEREEFTRRINGMSAEEKRLACRLMPSKFLLNEIVSRLIRYERKINDFAEMMK